MPRYLFTYHGKGTWMPDHPRGYVHRTHGLQPPDPEMADKYRDNQVSPTVVFSADMQHELIATARSTAPHLNATIHAIATENTHIHVLVSWNHEREWKSMRTSIRSAMSRAMNARFGKQEWFSESSSRKQVRDQEHVDYLLRSYLPGHSAHWVRAGDVRAAQRRDVIRKQCGLRRGDRQTLKKHR